MKGHLSWLASVATSKLTEEAIVASSSPSTKRLQTSTWNRFLKTLEELRPRGWDSGSLTQSMVEEVVVKWWQQAAIRESNKETAGLPLMEETVRRYVTHVVNAARVDPGFHTVGNIKSARVSKRIAALNKRVTSAHPEVIGRTEMKSTQPLTIENALDCYKVAESRFERGVASLMVIAVALMLRPGELVTFSPSWLRKECETFPRIDKRGRPVLWFNVPRYKVLMTNAIGPSLLPGVLIPHFEKFESFLRRKKASRILDIQTSPAKATAMVRDCVKELAVRADIPRAACIRLYSPRNGGVLSVQGSVDDGVIRGQAGISASSDTVAKFYGRSRPVDQATALNRAIYRSVKKSKR